MPPVQPHPRSEVPQAPPTGTYGANATSPFYKCISVWLCYMYSARANTHCLFHLQGTHLNVSHHEYVAQQQSQCNYNKHKLFGVRQLQLYFSNVFYYYYIPTICFGPYGPS
jgi:hypothetical protein